MVHLQVFYTVFFFIIIQLLCGRSLEFTDHVFYPSNHVYTTEAILYPNTRETEWRLQIFIYLVCLHKKHTIYCIIKFFFWDTYTTNTLQCMYESC